MPRPARVGPATSVSLVVFVLAACASPAKQAAALCDDLRHFSATIAVVTSPPAGETVGQVRAELNKLSAMIESIEDSTVISDPEAGELRAAQQAYLAQMSGVGDDDPHASVVVQTGIAARRLGQEFASIAARMGCPGAAGHHP